MLNIMAVDMLMLTNGNIDKYNLSIREFVTGVHRDSYASHIGHFSRVSYMAVAENESIAKTRYSLLNVLNHFIYFFLQKMI